MNILNTILSIELMSHLNIPSFQSTQVALIVLVGLLVLWLVGLVFRSV